jgi:hypothetical protein
MLVCSLCHAMAGSLSVANNAVSSAKFAVIISDEVGRSIVHSRYINGPKILPWGTPAFINISFLNSFSTFTRKCVIK